MKVLICTQKVDPTDPVLGFFVRWLEEFKKHADIEVISLKDLGGGGKLMRAWRLLRLASTKEYDAVLVHMNPEYVVAAGWLWRLKGKKIGLWYMHKSVDLKLRVAEKFANVIFTGSKESFRLPSTKVRVMGHGIDTDFFTPGSSVMREDWWVSVGRLNPSKRHDVAIREAAAAGKQLHIVGDGPEREKLEQLAKELDADVVFVGGTDQAGVRDVFRRAALFVHTSETGSLDKVVLEAVACGCPVRTHDPALKFIEHEGPDYVRANHSLERLIPAILTALS
jgi:glycosyltransferase involved in cell wall biosynthesis